MTAPSPRRTSVSVHEAGFVLQETERAVRGRLRRGQIADVGVGRGVRIDAAGLAGLVAGRPLRELALETILAGRLTVPRPSRRGGPPAGLEVLVASSGHRR